ncbi:MAG: acyl-CoA reductase [Chitinophagaceae bacterium]|nr:MAG: acyl-CoA reductase [Chitinophagaceae bacterium]
MNLQGRIDLMSRLGSYLLEDDAEWLQAKQQAYQKNGWFTPDFIDLACRNIANNFLDKSKLTAWARHYQPDDNIASKNVGIVMAGNIPLVGFHDFLAVFISGHHQTIKLSSKDDVLLRHFVKKLREWEPAFESRLTISELLKGCDAYIATGSNNSSRYFEQYFSKVPHIIRRNRTSAAVLSGNETADDLDKLSDDIHQYFGLGCRNVSKLFVPREYDFIPLIRSFDKYAFFADHHKYKNNYDYQFSLILLNNIYYMTNGATLLTENEALFSPISQLYFEYYDNKAELLSKMESNNDLQCVVADEKTTFGSAQTPGLFSYADGVDTMQFLLSI